MPLPLSELMPSILLGIVLFLVIYVVATGFYTVGPTERAVKTSFGRVERVGEATTSDLPFAAMLTEEEKQRYAFPQVRVIQPGGPYFKWPWEKIYKRSVATETINIALDPDARGANQGGTVLEAVTKDQLNTLLIGNLRYRISEQNLYAAIFGIKQPLSHIMGYFVSVLREHIANFEAPLDPDASTEATQSAVSINDLRKHLSALNDRMIKDCECSVARYGITLDASLITSIDPPDEVETALAAINTAHNQVSSDISRAQALADQKVTQSKSAVEVATNNAQAEVEPLVRLANELSDLKGRGGKAALDAYVRNVNLGLFSAASRAIVEVK